MGVQLPSEPITRKEQYLAKAAGQAVEIPAEPITREEAYLDAIAKGSGGGGGGGTSDYPQLTNKPQINGNTLVGNKTASQLGLASTADLAGKVDKVEGKGLSTNDYTDAEKAIVGGVTSALQGKVDKVEGYGLSENNYTNADKSIVGGVTTALTGKVDKVEGKGLSENDYTDSDKTIVDGVTAALALKQNVTDNSLDTEAKTIVGAINENAGDISTLKSGLTNLDNEVNGDSTTYPYADVITIEDAVPSNLAECNVKIEPVQDLHGYDKPWVGGAGDNKVPNTKYNGVIDSNGSYSSANNRICNDNTSHTSTMKLSSGTYTINIEGLDQCTVLTKNSNNQIVDNFADSWHNMPYTFTLTEEAFLYYSARKSNNDNISPDDYNTMLVIGETSKPYTPYENICPITKYDSCKITRVGKNILDAVNHLRGTASHNITSTANADGSISISGTADSTCAYITDVVNVDWEPGTYTFSIVTALSHNIYLELTYDDNTTQNIIIGSGNRSATITTAKKLKSYTLVISTLVNGTQYNETYYLQVEKGASATSFEPYKGNDYQIELNGNTYYGQLRIDTKGNVYFDIDSTVIDLGTLNWSKSSLSGHERYYVGLSGALVAGNIISDCFDNCNYNDLYNHVSDNVISMHTSTASVEVYSTYYISGYNAAQFKEAMSGHIACYKLATPFTIALKDTPINLVKGRNTIYADTGDIEVTVNNTMDAIGSVQEQVNELAKKLPDAPTTDGVYALTVTVADGTPTYSWESAE